MAKNSKTSKGRSWKNERASVDDKNRYVSPYNTNVEMVNVNTHASIFKANLTEMNTAKKVST